MFRIPPITKNLLIINILMFLATGILERNGIDLTDMLGLHFILSDSFMPHQLLTYMFMHANFEHIFFNMLAFWMFGRILEQVWGPRRYLIFYLVCGVGAGLCQELAQYIDYARLGLADYSMVAVGYTKIPMSQFLDGWTTVGASGAVYGILLGFGMSFPNERVILLIPPIPIKAKYLVMGYAVIELLSGLGTSDSNVAHFAHLGGMLFGLILILYWRRQTMQARQGFTSWREYKARRESWWDRLKQRMRQTTDTRSKSSSDTKSTSSNTSASGSSASSWSSTSTTSASDMAERRAKQEEIDRILDKVKRSGYSCLTEEEKKTIFDYRNK